MELKVTSGDPSCIDVPPMAKEKNIQFRVSRFIVEDRYTLE